MKNRYIFFLLLQLIIISNNVKAQVGINTETPYSTSILHARSDKSSSAGYENDLIIDKTTGNVGLGTATPSAKVDINGNFRFSDKKKADLTGKLLTTDSIGNASWKNFNTALHHETASWSLKDENYPDITTSNNIINLKDVSTFSSTIPGASVANGILTLPKGRYYITLSAGIQNTTNQYIYQIIRVFNGEDTLLESYFFTSATGLALFIDAKEIQNIRIQLEVLDVRSDPNQFLPFVDPLPIKAFSIVWANMDILTIPIGE